MTSINAQQEYTRWTELASDSQVCSWLHQLAQSDKQAIEDAFFQELEFGTAGLRGVIGAGTNRMNIYTVARATQGLASYLKATCETPLVVIARDSRNYGELFVETAACVLAANGVQVALFPRIEPVPALSFAVRDLGASAGIVMTASHNPAEYNGYKVYGSDGCQIANEPADAISAAIAQCDYFTGITSGDFDALQKQGKITWIADDVLDRFIEAELAASVEHPQIAGVDMRLVYTPLHGSGLELNSRLFSEMGIKDVTVVPEQRDPNGDFPTCPYPNPEVKEAMQCGIALSEQIHPDLLLATDPDADRVGIAVYDGEEYKLLTGNEVGVLMLDYLCKAHVANGSMPERPICVSTIVSTAMIDAIAANYGVEIKRTLTGFKYIGEIISALVDAGEAERYLLGFEESYGYLAATHVRDKDSVSASMVICQMAQLAKAQGKNLVSTMQALYNEYGYYKNKTVSISFPGATGAARMAEIMATLHQNIPQTVNGLHVVDSIDYQTDDTGLPRANVIELYLANDAKLIIRPSGTEPKVKAYLFAHESTEDEALNRIDQLEVAARGLLA